MSENPLPRLPRREATAHKGTYGRVGIVAGSPGLAGAAILAGRAALRGGAGLVTVACPQEIQAIVAMGSPCYMTLGFADGVIPTPFCESVDVLAIGPGLGRTAETLQLVRTVLSTDRPVVMDADALTMVVSELPLLRRSAPTILTPHPGEFARLVQRGTAEVQMERRTLAQQFAQTWGVVVLLKGHRTVITDGVNVFENTTGNPGMATGGSGDVLTGLLAALLPTMLSSGASVVDATRLAAWVHGRAGDLAAEALSQVALTAADVVEYLPAVFRELERRP